MRTALALLLLATLFGVGCAGEGVSPYASGENRVARSAGREWLAPPRADVFVTASNEVTGYARTGGPPVVTIVTQSHSAQGVAFDKKGNLYVTDLGDAFYPADVEVFASGSFKSPFMRVLNAALAEPVRVAIDPRGNIWVANNSDVESELGNLLEFSKKGALLQKVACPGLNRYDGGLAADDRGNVFVQGATSAGYLRVEKVPAGHSNCVILPAKSVFFGGLAVTKRGDLVVGDSYRRHASTYAAPSFRKIIATTSFAGVPRSGLGSIALTKDGAGIWVTSIASGGAALLYRYSHGGKPSVRIEPGVPLAIAVDY